MYDYERRVGNGKTARADTEVLREFNDYASRSDKVLRDTVIRIIRIQEPVQKQETYEIFRDMIEQEIRTYQRELVEVQKELKLFR